MKSITGEMISAALQAEFHVGKAGQSLTEFTGQARDLLSLVEKSLEKEIAANALRMARHYGRKSQVSPPISSSKHI